MPPAPAEGHRTRLPGPGCIGLDPAGCVLPTLVPPAIRVDAPAVVYPEPTVWWRSAVLGLAQRFAARIDLAAVIAGQSVRGYFGSLLSRDVPYLEALISELEPKTTAQHWASSRVKEGYKCVISFCKDVKERKLKTKGMKNPQYHISRTRQNNIRPASTAPTWEKLKYQLVYDDLIHRENFPYKYRLPVLETAWMQHKLKYLIGVEVKSTSGQNIFSRLSNLTETSSVTSLLACGDLHCKWYCHSGNPCVSVFLLRKGDSSRLCLTTDSNTGHGHHDDYAGRDEMTYYNPFTVAGTGDSDDAAARMCTAIGVEVRTTGTDSTLRHLEIGLDVREGDFHGHVVSTMEELLQTIEAPAFAARWIAPPQRTHFRKQITAPSSGLSQQQAPAAEHVCERLQRTVVTSPDLAIWTGTNVPSLLSVCLLHLSDVRDLVRAGQVCKGWHRASKHGTAWTQMLQDSAPTLKLLRGRRMCLHTCEQLYTQQRAADQAALVPLSPLPRTDYMLAVQIAESTLFCCDLAADGHETLLQQDVHIPNVKYDRITHEISLDGDINFSVKASLLRKRDSKCLHLFTCEGNWEPLEFIDPDETICLVRFGDYTSIRSALSADYSTRADVDVKLTVQDWGKSSKTQTIAALEIVIDTYEDEVPAVVNIGALLEMVEWPSFAHRWK